MNDRTPPLLRPRLVVALLVAVLVAAACEEGDLPESVREAQETAREAAEEVREAAEDAASPQGPEENDGEQTPTDGGGSADEEPGGDPDGGEPDGDGSAVTVPDDHAGLGAMCRPYLRGHVPRLRVEVAHQAGARPAAPAVDHLVGVLRSVVDKPAGIEITTREIPGSERRWSREDLADAAATHREHFSSPNELVMFVLAVNGEHVDGDTLGVAWNATELAIFPDEIGPAATLLGGRAAVERAVLVHEAGHLLCLINVGYTSEIDHEDPEHPRHSADRGSVMYWAIARDAISQVFSGPPPDDFTSNDRADLEGLRTGRF